MSEKRKELVVGFEVVIKEFESKFIGECKELPGLVVSGASTGEVIKNIKAAIPLFLRYVPKESFIPVFENSTMPVIYDFEEFNRHLYASTSKDAVIRTATGDIGAWENISVSNIFSPYFNPPVGSTKNFQEDSLGDYTPQAYCLKAFNDLGTPKLYAGTNANGGIYETLDGNNWSLAFNSGEARVHCLEAFRGRLFAGTSTEGKIYSYNGTHWVISLSTPELAITCFGLYRDYIYAGTYPNGMIYRTSDGVNWQKVFDTNQSFVNDFIVYKNRFYAATAKATGGLIFMSEDGTNWVENFFSEKDANFFKFGVFANSIYAGSGNNGRIYKSVDGKQWELAFQTDEEDIRSLVVFNGYLYFGSSPKGRIFRTTISNTPPPRAFDVQITDITSHSAVISWVTDREAKTIIEYGTTSSYGNTIMNEKKASSHRITLNNLKAVTEYHFRILTYSDIGSFSGIVEDHKFSTMAAITPVISSKTHPDQNKWYNSNEAGIHWGMHPEIKRYLYLADRNPETIPGPAKCESSTAEGVVLKGLEDGVWYVHFMIEDKAGNISPSVSHFTIRVDTSALPPKVTSATHADEAAWYDSNTPEFTWVPPEDMSGVEGYYYCVDELAVTVPNEKNGIFTEETKVRLEPVEDGVKYFHIVTKDKAGNTGTKASHFRFNVDTHAIPPLISSRTHPDPESWYNGKIVEIHLAKPHDLSGIEGFYFCVDSRPDTVPREHDWVYTRSSDIEIPERPDGVWYIHARSKDTAGNISKDASHFKFRIDTVAYPPNISSVTHPDTHKWYNIKKAQFKVMAPEDMSGIEGYYYIIDNEEKTVPGDTATWTDKDTVFSGDLKDGKWFLHVTAKDRAGNIGRSASHYSFNIDTAAKPPKVMSKTHADQEAWHNNPIPELHWETPEDISGIEGYYFIYDQKHNTVPTKEAGEWTTANQMTLPLLADGVWYFHIVSKDNAGNTGWEAAHYKIKIDTVVDQPKIHSSTHPDETKWYCGSAVKLGWTVPQDLSKIKVFHWVFSKEKYMKLPIEMAQQTDKREMEIDVDKEGTYYFHISGEDNAGNIGSEPAVFGVNIDLKAEPPEIISTTHPNSDRYYADIHPVFVLEQNRDLSGVEGYYYKLDREKDTAPDRKTARFSKENVIKIAEPLEAGTWYFHVITKDRAGNTGAEAAHYRIQIETTPPEVSVKPLPEFSPSENFEVGWEGEDSESGILCFTAEYKEGEKGKWKGWLKETRAKSG
ncbi:MAG TPA: fibronectin type III domain-containing protein, partial [bacterium]|nr:fibronectin type III domain-containing protein [bacterium]